MKALKAFFSTIQKGKIVATTPLLTAHKNRSTQLGQGMTEYIIIVALIAVAAIGVYQFFGQTVRQQTAGIAAEVAGQSATAATAAAGVAAGRGAAAAGQSKGLSTYNNDDTRGQ